MFNVVKCFCVITVLYIYCNHFALSLFQTNYKNGDFGPWGHVDIDSFQPCRGRRRSGGANITYSILQDSRNRTHFHAHFNIYKVMQRIGFRIFLFKWTGEKFERSLTIDLENICLDIKMRIKIVPTLFDFDEEKQHCYRNKSSGIREMYPIDLAKALFPIGTFYGVFRAKIIMDTPKYNFVCFVVDFTNLPPKVK